KRGHDPDAARHRAVPRRPDPGGGEGVRAGDFSSRGPGHRGAQATGVAACDPQRGGRARRTTGLVSRMPRRRYWKNLLRQIWWTSVPVWSFGLLSFAPFLRLALERRRRKDWAIAGGYLTAAAVLASFPFSGTVAVVSTTFGLCLAFFAAVHAAVAFRPAPGGVLSTAAEDQPAVAAAPQHNGVPEAATNERVLEAARGRIARRAAAVRLARADPLLARELRIGRPDLPREYDDGGIVDVNHVPGAVLEAHLGLTPDEIASLLSARDHLGAFSSLDELSAYCGLKPDRVDEFRDRIMLG